MMKLVAMVDLPVQCTLTALCFWMVMVILISAKWSETLHTGAALARATVPIGYHATVVVLMITDTAIVHSLCSGHSCDNSVFLPGEPRVSLYGVSYRPNLTQIPVSACDELP